MKLRICPDCESRQLEYRQKFCSECAEIRSQISHDIARHDWIAKNPVQYAISNKKQNDKRSEYKRQWALNKYKNDIKYREKVKQEARERMRDYRKKNIAG
jgi:hypothetical protein